MCVLFDSDCLPPEVVGCELVVSNALGVYCVLYACYIVLWWDGSVCCCSISVSIGVSWVCGVMVVCVMVNQ